MKTYRHREDRHLVLAKKAVFIWGSGYEISDYYAHRGGSCEEHGPPTSVCLTSNDFEKLFEPIPEYCCEWFRKCVENKVFRKDTVQDHQWVWGELDEYFTRCPFCKTKL